MFDIGSRAFVQVPPFTASLLERAFTFDYDVCPRLANDPSGWTPVSSRKADKALASLSMAAELLRMPGEVVMDQPAFTDFDS